MNRTMLAMAHTGIILSWSGSWSRSKSWSRSRAWSRSKSGPTSRSRSRSSK